MLCCVVKRSASVVARRCYARNTKESPHPDCRNPEQSALLEMGVRNAFCVRVDFRLNHHR